MVGFKREESDDNEEEIRSSRERKRACRSRGGLLVVKKVLPELSYH